MENHLSVTLPLHDQKKAEESVPDRQSWGEKPNYASNIKENKSCTKGKTPDLEKVAPNGASLDFW